MQILRIAHSPDADDVLMFWAIRKGHIDTGNLSFQFETADTQTLNQWASQGAHHIIAVSAAHYAAISKDYQPLRMGTSVGSGYGPVILTASEPSARELSELLKFQPATDTRSHPNARAHSDQDTENQALHPLNQWTLLTPGLQTTSHVALRSLGATFGGYQTVPITPIEHIFEELKSHHKHGRKTAALVIHEGRLIFQQHGLHLAGDVGKMWKTRFGVNLPLGINVIQRSLPQSSRLEISRILRQSLLFGQEHRQDFGIEYLSGTGVLDGPALNTYLDMYANDTTLDISQADRQAFNHLIQFVSPEPVPTDWI
jgi:1,4-dihydroxy-6-naphthoate synthase